MSDEPEIAAAAVTGRRFALAEKIEQLERELGRFRAIAAAAAKRARDARTAKLEAVVEVAYEANSPAIQMLPIHSRTAYLIGRLAAAPEKFGLTKLPSMGKVREIVRRFAARAK